MNFLQTWNTSLEAVAESMIFNLTDCPASLPADRLNSTQGAYFSRGDAQSAGFSQLRRSLNLISNTHITTYPTFNETTQSCSSSSADICDMYRNVSWIFSNLIFFIISNIISDNFHRSHESSLYQCAQAKILSTAVSLFYMCMQK